jgi:TonB family protein
MNRLTILLMLLPSIAWSQGVPAPAAPPAATANAGTLSLPADVTQPKAINPHICPPSQYYPGSAVGAGISGETVIVFTIGTDGKVHDAAAVLTSGSATIDQAATTCVQTFLYAPAQYKAAPIAITWEAAVSFALNGNLIPHPRIDAASTPCREPPMNAAVSGAAIVFVDVGNDGKITQTSIARSSGDAAFDAYATTCISHWIYKPGMDGDRPVATRTVAIVNPKPN